MLLPQQFKEFSDFIFLSVGDVFLSAYHTKVAMQYSVDTIYPTNCPLLLTRASTSPIAWLTTSLLIFSSRVSRDSSFFSTKSEMGKDILFSWDGLLSRYHLQRSPQSFLLERKKNTEYTNLRARKTHQSLPLIPEVFAKAFIFRVVRI